MGWHSEHLLQAFITIWLFFDVSAATAVLPNNGWADCPCQGQIEKVYETINQRNGQLEGQLQDMQVNYNNLHKTVSIEQERRQNLTCQSKHDVILQYRKILQFEMDNEIQRETVDQALRNASDQLDSCCAYAKNISIVLNAKVVRCSSDIVTVQKDVANLGSEVSTAKADALSRDSQMEMNIKQLESRLTDTESNLKAEKARNQELLIKLSLLNKEMKNLNSNLQNLRGQLIETSKWRFIDIYVESLGYDDTSRPLTCTVHCGQVPVVRIDGKEIYSWNNNDYIKRGWTFIVLDGKTGNQVKTGIFDTLGNATHDQLIQNFYDAISNNSIVIVCTYDEPSGNAVKALEVLQHLGASNLTPSYRDAIAMIGYKGYTRPNWIAVKHVTAKNGIAIAESRVPLML